MRTRIKGVGRVRTLYVGKAVKVVPVNEEHGAGIKQSREERWSEWFIKEENERGSDGEAYLGVLIPNLSTFQRERRLTQAGIRKPNIGQHLTTNERDPSLEMPFDRETAIAFDSAEKGRFYDFIEPPHMIPTVPQRA